MTQPAAITVAAASTAAPAAVPRQRLGGQRLEGQRLEGRPLEGRPLGGRPLPKRQLGLVMLAVALWSLAWALVALDAQATYGARVTADEPQYLTTAISLSEDFDLDISDELDDRRFVPFHEADLNEQTIPLNER